MVEDFEEKPMERLDLEQYCALVSRRRWHILIPLFVGWLVVCGASWVLPTVYKSGTLILVEQPTKSITVAWATTGLVFTSILGGFALSYLRG